MLQAANGVEVGRKEQREGDWREREGKGCLL